MLSRCSRPAVSIPPAAGSAAAKSSPAPSISSPTSASGASAPISASGSAFIASGSAPNISVGLSSPASTLVALPNESRVVFIISIAC